MTSYGDIGDTTQTTVTAGTATKITTITMLPGGPYRIKKLRVAIGSDSDQLIPIGYVELKIDRVSGPFKFPVGMGQVNAGTAAGEVSWQNAEEIDLDIEVPGNAKVEVWGTFQDAVDVTAGIVYVG
ncbi:MAG: hypothetical protein DRP09_18200 [Candidatus Thorarchaeota archaeon]|nr:MAG: hypothetical protein DRP09_18200 [Candidatus Thorarchaeota archaeon]